MVLCCENSNWIGFTLFAWLKAVTLFDYVDCFGILINLFDVCYWLVSDLVCLMFVLLCIIVAAKLLVHVTQQTRNSIKQSIKQSNNQSNQINQPNNQFNHCIQSINQPTNNYPRTNNQTNKQPKGNQEENEKWRLRVLVRVLLRVGSATGENWIVELITVGAE